ncbi:hypothetical protein MWN34_08210 [Ancylobacter sp. 6x-1]|uniref:Uncharacterized protein n=1 Tax=Ancylobacter crimeensis TaxID=2579147 RepID=A0ABT0DAD5_9HYPH|nr:hypothetical protein [Ancylobacter crimeensis]MCK0196895.1 hypothetical protein [Ancylobacter crimeensis]
MPDLSRFAIFASKSRPVPLVPQPVERRGTKGETGKAIVNHTLGYSVPRVPHVPRQNDVAENASRSAGVVPRVPHAPEGWGTSRGTAQSVEDKGFVGIVPSVPLVPRENDDGGNENEWRYAYDERAGILEYDEGLPRAEAERLAAEQIAHSRFLARER